MTENSCIQSPPELAPESFDAPAERVVRIALALAARALAVPAAAAAAGTEPALALALAALDTVEAAADTLAAAVAVG